MSDDYLYSKTGKDEEVERLERLLRPLAFQPGTFSPTEAPEPQTSRAPRTKPGFSIGLGLLVATAMLAAAVFLISLHVDDEVPVPPVPSVPPPSANDAPKKEPEERVLAGETPFRLEPGQAIRTADRVTLVLGGRIGTLVAEKDARLRVLALTNDLQKVRLDRGTVHAKIGANVHPGLFQVETPASTCVDLGCHYTLTVDESGRALVHVETGRVAFVDAGGHEVFVPRGAHCRAVPSKGSGTPVFDDSPDELAAAVSGFDEAKGEERLVAAKAIASNAKRARDTLPLWHLLGDGDAQVVEVGVDALVRLAPLGAIAPLPEGVTREATIARAPGTLEKWKEHLRAIWEE